VPSGRGGGEDRSLSKQQKKESWGNSIEKKAYRDLLRKPKGGTSVNSSETMEEEGQQKKRTQTKAQIKKKFRKICSRGGEGDYESLSRGEKKQKKSAYREGGGGG